MFSSNTSYINDIRNIIKLPLPWENLKNSTVLITGASGMIGTMLSDVLMELNKEYGSSIRIYALGRSEKRLSVRFKDYLNHPLFEPISCDINCGLPLEYPADYIIHCASNTHPNAYAADPIGTIMTNVLGTDHILKAAKAFGSRRIVFLSSVEIYGENRGDTELFDETYCGYIDCNTLRAGYPEGKRTGEALCQAYIQAEQLDIVIPRISRVFGPTMLLSDSKALSQFLKKAVLKENIVLKSDGSQYFSYCYAGDVISALFYILFWGEKGQAYNVADPHMNIRLRELAGVLAEVAGTKVVFEVPDELEARGYSKATKALLNADRLHRLGWQIQSDLRTQLEKTVQILRDIQQESR